MTGFYITIKNGLLDPKHVKAMKGERTGTVWLFLWLLDKMTIINHEIGEGKVLGGKPIKYEDIKKELEITRITYTRYLKTLRDGGYIKTTRTPYGLSITIFKAFKVFGQKTDVSTKLHLPPTSDTSLYRGTDTSNIRQYSRQYNKDNTADKNYLPYKEAKEIIKEKMKFPT